MLENDKDLKYSRLIDSRYGLQDYLVMTFAPRDDLFSDKALANLSNLCDEIRALKTVSSVLSILDVPLLESPPVPIKELAANIQTLKSPTVLIVVFVNVFGSVKTTAVMEVQNHIHLVVQDDSLYLFNGGKLGVFA